MDPVEINAGNWYLLARDTDAWAAGRSYGWSVCEATTAEVQATVTLSPDGTLRGEAFGGHHEALAAALDAVDRFATGALGVTVRVAADDPSRRR